jgi:hypothetical protein
MLASCFPREKARILALLLERVAYDGRVGEVSLKFRPGGVRTLATAVQARDCVITA